MNPAEAATAVIEFSLSNWQPTYCQKCDHQNEDDGEESHKH